MGELTLGHLATRRTARFALLGERVAEPVELWIVVHGYRQLADRFIRHFRILDDGTRRIVAPEALSRFYLDEDGGAHGPDHRVGASWMTRHEREAEIGDYVAYLDALVALQRARVGSAPRLIVLGFSQGAHTVARWVTSSAAAPPHTTVLWGAPLPGDLDAEVAAPRLAATDLVQVRGRNDGHRSPEAEAREAATLAGWGVRTRRVEHDEGHVIVPSLLAGLVDR